MAWSSPKTMGAEAGVSSDWNTYVRDNLNYLKGITDGVSFSGTEITRSAGLSLTTGVFTAVSFDTETFDYGGWHASGTDVVAPAGAIPSGYTTIMLDCRAQTSFAANGTGVRYVRLMKNGAQFAAWSQSAISGETTDLLVSKFVTAVVGDIITLELKQTSGGALNASSSTSLTVVRFAPVV